MRKLAFKLLLLFAAVLFFWGIVYFGLYVTPHENAHGTSLVSTLRDSGQMTMLVFIVGLLGYFIVMFLPDRDGTDRPKKWHSILWIFTLLISTPFAISKYLFAKNGVEPILLFFKDNQMSDMLSIGSDGFTVQIRFWACIMLIIISTSFILRCYKRHFGKVLVVVSFTLLALSPLTHYVFRSLIPNEVQRDFIVTQRMHDLNIVQKPSHKKNMVLIYLESLERSYGQIPEYEKFYNPIQVLADSAIEYDNFVETKGANYTIAGIVATHCGIPLLPNGLQSVFLRRSVDVALTNFLPSVRCFSDQLSDDGYILSYMNGASLDKFSKRTFLQEHGYSRLFDKANLSVVQKESRSNVWGLNDAVLFEKARSEFDILSKGNEPFIQTLLTLSTHGPDAFLSNDCPPEPNLSSQVPRAIECTGELLTDFVDYIRASDVADDTVIVILSDHLAFHNSVQLQLDGVGDLRRNLFLVLNNGAAKKMSRQITSFDVYPILLETLGYQLKNGRANLGVAISSDDQNLVEELGVETMNEVFTGNQKLAAYFWRDNEMDDKE